jgi:ABC-type phosphate transport system substrate-binding protein
MLKKIMLAAAVFLSIASPRTAEAQSGRYVVIVNPRNPIQQLSSFDVSRIFLGKLQAWNIKGQIEPVAPVDQKADSPVRAAFSQRVLRKTVSEADSYWRQELYAGRNVPPPQQSEDEALETVRETLGAIAYVSATADLKGVKVLNVP